MYLIIFVTFSHNVRIISRYDNLLITKTISIMKLITKAIERAFEKQGDTSEMDMSQIKIVMKLFNPIGAGTWYIYDRVQGNEDIMWCFANLGDPINAELGTVSMSELQSLRLPLGLKIERDRSFEPLSMTLEYVYNRVKSGKHV